MFKHEQAEKNAIAAYMATVPPYGYNWKHGDSRMNLFLSEFKHNIAMWEMLPYLSKEDIEYMTLELEHATPTNFYNSNYLLNEYRQPINYKILLGDRSIGKTHYTVSNMRANNRTFCLLRRVKTEISQGSINPFCSKYGTFFDGEPWRYKNGEIWRCVDDTPIQIIGYVQCLSGSERGKNLNFDNPHVTDIIVDEIYSYKPNKHEWQELQTWITTLNRSTGSAVNRMNVWLLGNPLHGYSPILRQLNLHSLPKGRFKREYPDKHFSVTYEFSDIKSADGVINYFPSYVKKWTEQTKKYADLIFTVHIDKFKYDIYVTSAQIYIEDTSDNKPSEPLEKEHINHIRKLYSKCTNVKEPVIFASPRAMQLKEYLTFIP